MTTLSKLDNASYLFDDNDVEQNNIRNTKLGKKPKIKTARVNMVIEPGALALIREVAIKSGTSISSFMVIAATEAAKLYKERHLDDFAK